MSVQCIWRSGCANSATCKEAGLCLAAVQSTALQAQAKSDVSPEAREAAERIRVYYSMPVASADGLEDTIQSAITRALAAQKADLICPFDGHALDVGANEEMERLRAENERLTRELRTEKEVHATCEEGLRLGCKELRACIATLEHQVEEMGKDKARLDWLESQTDGSPWVARKSTTGRGYRVHNTGRPVPSSEQQARPTVRAAIDAATAATNEGGSNA